MKQNMGPTDRIMRGLLAVLLTVFFLLGLLEGTLAMVLGIIAAIFLLSATLGYCPLYSLLGLKTSKT